MSKGIEGSVFQKRRGNADVRKILGIFQKIDINLDKKLLKFDNDILGVVYKGRPANGEGVVLKFRTFPDEGSGL